MTPQELKNSILQLAIQGKLVEQRSEEGTAEELYQQIQEEKRRLVKEGKIKKGKPSPEITEDEVPFEIPVSWKWVHLSDSGFTQTGNTPSKSHPEYVGSDIPFITPGDIVNSCISCNNQALSNIGRTVARICGPNTILQVCIGGSIGKAAVTTQEVAFNQQINSISPIYCNSHYIYSVIVSRYFITTMRKVAGGTATPIINRGLWDKLPIPLPPLSEQERIVAKIEELLPYIDRYEQAWNRLENLNKKFPIDMQKSLLQMAIQGKLVEQRPEEGTVEELYKQIQEEKQRLIKERKIKKEKPLPEIMEDEKPFEIPENWMWVRLGNILNKLVDGTHRTPKYTTSGIPFVSVRDMSGGVLDLSSTKYISQDEHEEFFQRCNPEKGDILLSKIGTTGVPAKVDTDTPFSLFVSVALLKFDDRFIDADFLIYAILSPNVQKQCREHTRGVGNKNWVIKDIANTVSPLPPLAEQKRIVTKLEELLPLCERLE